MVMNFPLKISHFVASIRTQQFFLSVNNSIEHTRCFYFNVKFSHDKKLETNFSSNENPYVLLVSWNLRKKITHTYILLLWNAYFARFRAKSHFSDVSSILQLLLKKRKFIYLNYVFNLRFIWPPFVLPEGIAVFWEIISGG